jgi:hypothetical protein
LPWHRQTSVGKQAGGPGQEQEEEERRWRSVYSAVVCVKCHPPADAALVAPWEGAA